VPSIRLTRRRPRYADVAATLALILAMGGTAYAATALPRNSVGTPQLKAQAVTNPKIAKHAITAAKLARGAVTVGSLGGADVTGALNISLPAHGCGAIALTLTGVKVGEAGFLTFVGTHPVPASLTFGPIKVLSANHAVVQACNQSGTTLSVTNLGVRIITVR
jgi:hypothetical protein